MRKRKKGKRTLLLAAACCGAAALAWLGMACVHAVGDGRRLYRQLDLATAQTEFLAPAGSGQDRRLYVSENNDPKLRFAGIAQDVRLVRFSASFAAEPGEMELFYTRGEGEAFSARRRVIGVPEADGSYLYALPAGPVHSLRIDPGTASGNAVAVYRVEVNPRLPLAYYFVPSLRDVLGLLFWAGLALCVLGLPGSARGLFRRRSGAPVPPPPGTAPPPAG